ncbi:MAG: response regulator transcription factor [Bacteroidota bacterium]
MTISIYEDNEKLRDLIEMLIGSSNEFTVKGSYPNAKDILNKVIQDQPDVIIMDIDMPEHDGIGGVREVKKFFPDVKILMHTVFDDDDRLFTCLSYGADGYILKKDAPTFLFNAIKEVLAGGAPMSAGIATRVLQTFRKAEKPKNNYHLTEREKEILELLTKGFSYRMIGIECTISIETVRRHLKNIYQKLHVQCGTEAVAKAIQERLLNE